MAKVKKCFGQVQSAVVVRAEGGGGQVVGWVRLSALGGVWLSGTPSRATVAGWGRAPKGVSGAVTGSMALHI